MLPSMKTTQKNSETLQVRLPHGLKRDFMARCDQEGQAASEVLRGFITSYLARPVEILTSEKAAMIRRRLVYPTLALAGLIGAVAVMVPREGLAGDDLAAAFAEMDLDRDGKLTTQELQPPMEGLTVTLRPTVVSASSPKPSPGVTSIGPAVPWSSFAQQIIDDRDQDGDHRMNLAEFRAFRTISAQETFMARDIDRDGRLSLTEFLARRPDAPSADATTWTKVGPMLATRFEHLDADRDGFLTPAEYTPA